MSIDFSNINLEIIDINTNTTLEIFINTSGVTFSKKVIEELHSPQYVQFCLDPSQKIFAIRPCRSCDIRSVPFMKNKTNPKVTLNLANKNLRETITLEGTLYKSILN